jgi:hypothetical protein
MTQDLIRYDLLTQDALRGMVRRVLIDAAKNGLPGDHHFYVTFDTRAPGVRVSGRLRAKYPEDMTIVLQHQFWDLAVTEHTFEVGLSFGGIPERLLVPFSALKGFFDPSVQFGLQFEPAPVPGEAAGQDDASAEAPADTPSPPRGAGSEPHTLDPAATDKARSTKGSVPRIAPARKPEAVEETAGPDVVEPPPAPESTPAAAKSADVVSLDKFRKK